MHSTHSVTIQQKGDKIQRYEHKSHSDLLIAEDIAGFDANVLVDLVESEEFKQNIQEQINIGIWKMYTTNVALGEARHVLIKKRKYAHQDATQKLQNILKEFNITKIDHTTEGNRVGNQWVEIVKKQMHVKNFLTFPSDCRILANLFTQVNVNLYFTEDQDMEKATRILHVPIRIIIVGEASQLNSFEVKRFFKEQFNGKHKGYRKFWKRR